MEKYNVDFTTIPEEYSGKITIALAKLDCTPVMICRMTNHPEDDKLFVVIAQYEKPHPIYGNSYCVWECNVFSEQASLFYGHYGISFREAMKLLLSKTRDLNVIE